LGKKIKAGHVFFNMRRMIEIIAHFLLRSFCVPTESLPFAGLCGSRRISISFIIQIRSSALLCYLQCAKKKNPPSLKPIPTIAKRCWAVFVCYLPLCGNWCSVPCTRLLGPQTRNNFPYIFLINTWICEISVVKLIRDSEKMEEKLTILNHQAWGKSGEKMGKK